MKKSFLFFCLSLLVFLSTSCKFSKMLKSDDTEKKYAMALKLYDEKDYSRALQLFDQLMGVMRATDKAQKIYYYQAYCYYYSKDYTMASYYFKRFSTNFPNTREAEECSFMSAFCNCQNSPEYSLDQTTTKDALKELQAFINTYPDSKRLSECNDLIDKMRGKLETKDYRIALMYYRMDDYIAAITAFNNILKDYPETQKKEELLFLIFKASNTYALESVITKKKERIVKAFAAYNDLATAFPSSKLLPEAKWLKAKSQDEIDYFGIKNRKKYKKNLIKQQ
ncbi:MAG: outer membrane protein assembly factor BamD [Bacteroidetes bacterium]|nr:outer membrane protein assembly factor BamD [Bacteroidota bacterium]